MARACSTCAHPDRAAIEIGLANGVACRVLGARYGLDSSQLSRHRTKHMPAELLARLRVRGARSDAELAKLREVESKSLLDNLAWQRGRMYGNADRAVAIGDDAGERAAIGEASKITERIAKLVGELGQHITVKHEFSLVASPEWHVIRMALVRELRPLGADAIAAGARAIAAAEASIARPEMPSGERVPILIEHEAQADE